MTRGTRGAFVVCLPPLKIINLLKLAIKNNNYGVYLSMRPNLQIRSDDFQTSSLVIREINLIRHYRLCESAYIVEEHAAYSVWLRLVNRAERLYYISTTREDQSPRLYKKLDTAWEFIKRNCPNIHAVTIIKKGYNFFTLPNLE